ncbi:MAG: PSD1 and planctomycete cytochrome C domain-containing protein [Saprospiraceae bacterium]|nr:PSD1 and planctomycete cytochrome C domain-containing protein [Saprospiraceae bacterium]MDZ4704136.1 PSD1 and planctomycete cytochrome C domain-containing protein [Saprospiraceae bacterium]
MKRTITATILITGIIGIVLWSTRRAGSDEPDRISYNFHVRPILSDKCFTCHGPDQNKLQAGLRLDLAEKAYAPLPESPGAFAIVPGKPEVSELMNRITSADPDFQMPPPDSHLSLLTEHEIEIIRKWIEQGAVYEKHWAFIPPKKAALPVVKDRAWVKNEIDHFTLAKMAEKGLKTNEAASAEHLLKRISVDLTGLLPTEDEMNQFAADNPENAYEKAVDRLLASPHYGEKMALYWLDVARYSDSYGYQDDNIRTQWPYRDWVIHAFNTNLPYDRFVTWQLAGDLLPKANKEQILATAFLRNHKYTEEGGVIPEEYRVEYVLDKVKTYSKGLLALTVECAQCHDHKYDPVSQKDYYQVFGFFNTSKEAGFEGDVSVSKPAKTPILTLSEKEIKAMLTFINQRDTGSVTVSVMEEADTARATHILNRGAYDQPTDLVKPGALAAVLPFDTTRYQRNRLGLAGWTVAKENPLTARVFVNQLWQEFFGAGLVKTTGDFGMQGNLPTHPELLDWLAVDFMEHDWDIKRLVKQIVLSATYRQSSEVKPQHLEVDPENLYLARSPRLRFKAELIRDMVLATSNLLVKDIGGPSVKPYQPKGLWEVASSGRGALKTYEQDQDSALYRRGLYTFIKLTLPPPSMMMFDASNRDQCEVKRTSTNTPLQALIMMNDPTVLEASRVFAQRLQAENKGMETNLSRAFRNIICRKATPKEMEILKGYYAEQLALFKAKQLNAYKTLAVGEFPINKKLDLDESAALMKVVNTIYNLEEAITKS